MTEAGTRIRHARDFQALTGKPVVTDLWDASFPNGLAHIELSRGADAIVVAPASADFLAKLAHGLADDLLSTTCLARNCPLLVAPAMNREMWDNPATQRNVHALRADGVTILGPAAGDQACGEVGHGAAPRARRAAGVDPRVSLAQAAGGAQGARHRRPHLRGYRHGARHHQPQLREDGIRARRGGRGLGRRRDAGVRAHVARAARKRALRVRDERRRDAQRGERARPWRRSLLQRGGGGRLHPRVRRPRARSRSRASPSRSS